MVSAVLLKMWHCAVGPCTLPFCRSKAVPFFFRVQERWKTPNLRPGATRKGGITSCLLVIVCVNWPRTVEVPSKVEFLIGLSCGLVQ